MTVNSPAPSIKDTENFATYESANPSYVLAVSSVSNHRCRRNIAAGSFIEGLNNRVDILSFDEDTHASTLIPSLSVDHPYLATKMIFHPKTLAAAPELLASDDDYLRPWEICDGGASIEPAAMLNNSNTEFCAPITSFD